MSADFKPPFFFRLSFPLAVSPALTPLPRSFAFRKTLPPLPAFPPTLHLLLSLSPHSSPPPLPPAPPSSLLTCGLDSDTADLLSRAAVADPHPAARLAAVQGLGAGLCPVGHRGAVEALLACLR